MSAETIENIYCEYVRPRPRAERLRLIELASKDLAADEPEQPPQKRRSLLELEGLGAEHFPKMDAQEYVNALRAEWDHRP